MVNQRTLRGRGLGMVCAVIDMLTAMLCLRAIFLQGMDFPPPPSPEERDRRSGEEVSEDFILDSLTSSNGQSASFSFSNYI